jgi:hypothetical protein
MLSVFVLAKFSGQIPISFRGNLYTQHAAARDEICTLAGAHARWQTWPITSRLFVVESGTLLPHLTLGRCSQPGTTLPM